MSNAIQWLWPTPVLHYNLKKEGKVSHDLHAALQEFAIRNQEKLFSDTVRSSTRKTLYTRYDLGIFQRSRNPALKTIKELLLKECDSFVSEVYDTDPDAADKSVNMWFVLQRSGEGKDAVHPHYHEASDIAFVYYVEVPTDGSGALSLIDPRGAVGRGGFAIPRHSLVKFINPEQGDLIIFPRYLMHYTTPNTDERTRCVIAGSISYNVSFAHRSPRHPQTAASAW